METKSSPVTEAVLHIDRELAGIEREIEFLLNLTPVNAAEAWADFERNGFATEPTLQSRELPFEPDLVRRRLYDLTAEDVDDPGLHELFVEKRDELALEITLLADRDTSRFLYGSLQIFGDADEPLIREARHLLEGIEIKPTGDRRVTAGGFAEAAGAELAYYASRYEGLDLGLEIRSDISDLMVSHGRLLIPAQAYFRSGRVDALVQHEVGTHMLTYANGNVQPLSLLAVGLPHYEETQEGLAVLAEYLVGGLDPNRLRLLAGRVLAVSRVVEGKGVLEVFEELHDGFGFAPKVAWAITIRVTRAGGMRRVPRGSDPRANISTGGKPAAAQITPRELSMVEQMTSRLKRDGMFLVGIDVVGDKVIEINVESAGGLQSVQHFTGVDFSDAIVEALEERTGSA